MTGLAERIKSALAGYRRTDYILECGKYRLRAGKRTLVMGILNLTPDSFSRDGMYRQYAGEGKADRRRIVPGGGDVERVVARAEEMVAAGADILDVGGESTRPEARRVSEEEECGRILPVIGKLAKRVRVPVSVDTGKAAVARRALDAGAVIVNDVTALRGDPEMAEVVARRRVPVVLMHCRGTPRTMQRDPRYQALIPDIMAALFKSVRRARQAGVAEDKIIVDPGIGFGKTVEHNLAILRNLREFKTLGFPLLIGLSRKSFIGKVLGLPVEERIFGTAAALALAVAGGADIVRVHDVREMVQVARMVEAIEGR